MPIKDAVFLEIADVQLARIFQQDPSVVWYLDWKLMVGLVLWLTVWTKWIVYGYSGSYGWKYVYTTGINFTTLHMIQYYRQKGLFFVMCGLVLQTALSTWIWWKDKNVLKAGGFSATSVYEDLSTPLLQVFTLFIGQMCLIVFYLSSMFNKLNPEAFSFIFWLTSFFCLQMAAFFNRGADSYLGTTWHTSQWSNIITVAPQVEWVCEGFGGKPKANYKGRFELRLRGIFGFVVNNIFRDILAFTIPILLSQFTDPLNFVVYCVGVNFIVTIDDMQPKRFNCRTPSEELVPPSLWDFSPLPNTVVESASDTRDIARSATTSPC